jgi:hypothetical protein
MRLRLAGVLILLGAAGCAARPASPEAPLVRLVGHPAVDGYRLTLIPAAGARINARLPPELELAGGVRVRFEQTALTPDSAYFGAPPEATLERGWHHVTGTLRVGVCPAGLNVCKALAIPIDTVFAAGS